MAANKTAEDIDALFAFPLAEFTGARNALAARLKKEGRGEEAARVKALAKPPISAWAANQLYWKHREAFDRLIATGERFRKAQALQFAGKTSDVREALAARREAVSDLSQLASQLLSEGGHNPTPEILRRIATTLEALSAYTALPDAIHPGRLTSDLDPPGFDSLAGLIPAAPRQARPGEPELKEPPRHLEKMAKAALQDAERALREARAKAHSADAALKRAQAEAEEAAKIVEDAERAVDKASQELRSLRPQ